MRAERAATEIGTPETVMTSDSDGAFAGGAGARTRPQAKMTMGSARASSRERGVMRFGACGESRSVGGNGAEIVAGNGNPRNRLPDHALDRPYHRDLVGRHEGEGV